MTAQINQTSLYCIGTNFKKADAETRGKFSLSKSSQVLLLRDAKNNGFQKGTKPKTGYYAFADIDDEFLITIHHWIKWYKCGYQ